MGKRTKNDGAQEKREERREKKRSRARGGKQEHLY